MVFIGLDISKKFIDVCIKYNDFYKYQKIDNEIQSIKSFIADLLFDYQKEDLFACCEYTNIYYLDIANELYKSGIKISVENAVSINYFARAQLSRIKTDKSDSKLIADYCSMKKPCLWQPIERDIQVIKDITKRIDQMQKMQTMAKNQRKTASAEVVNSCIETVDFFRSHIAGLEEQLEEFICSRPQLLDKRQLLLTIPSIGKKTANILLVVFAQVDRFRNSKKLVSYLGLSPMVRQSGSSVRGKTRISKMGDSFLRKTLYMPALVACNSCKDLKDFKQRYLDRGKSKKQAIVVMMRKIVVWAYSVVSSGKPFDISKINFN